MRYKVGSGVVEADADPFALAGVDHHLVPQPAFPQEEAPRRGFGTDEGPQMVGRVVGAPRRRHQHRQPRVLQLERARTRSEERRVGKEGVSTWRYWWWPAE